jgi:exopolysaccharide production protein ExoY
VNSNACEFHYSPPMALASRSLPTSLRGPATFVAGPLLAGRQGRLASATSRSIDLVLALGLLLVTAPIVLVLAVLVKATSPGPAFFRQVRVGAGGRRFLILKLRTMVSDAEEQLERDPGLRHEYLASHFKVPSGLDPRLTPVGRFLRKTSLDELPQLVNVLRGQMSMVGPRPVVPEELEMFGDLSPAYMSVRPGLTGYWQVCGRSLVTGTDRLALDRHYLENRNILLDLKILLLTIPAVLRCRGAH